MIKNILISILIILSCTVSDAASRRLAKYGVQLTIDFELYEVDGVDLRTDWTPAGSDTVLMKDEGFPTDTANTATDETVGFYSIVLTATEMQAARLVLKIVDAATKVFLDTVIIIETYGNASALHAFDLDTASVAQSADNDTKISTLITGVELNADAITAAKIADNALANEHFADGALTSTEITSVGNAALAAGAITDASLAGNMEIVFETDFGTNYNTTRDAWVNNYTDIIGTMDAAAFGADFITAAKIADNAIAAEHIATAAIGADEIATDAIGAAEIAANAIGASELATDAIGAAELAANAVDLIWDEVISMAAHNVGQSAGKILRLSGDLAQIDGAVSDVSPAVTGFDTNLTQVDGFFEDAVMIFANGAANAGIGRPVVTYLNTGGAVTFLAPDDWPVTPVNGDDFIIFGTHVHPLTQIADAVLDEALSGHSSAGTLGKAVTDTETDVAAILVDTAVIGALGVGLTDLGGMSTTMKGQVNTEVDGALNTAIPGSPVAGSVNNALNNQNEIILEGAASGTHSTTTMQTNLTVTDAGQYNGRIITFTSDTATVALRNQQTDITDTVIANSELTFTALSRAPQDGDKFVIN